MGELHGTTPPESVLTDAVMALLRGSELGVAVFDDEDILRFANESFARMFHRRPDGRSTWLDLMRANHAQRRGSVVSGDADFEAWLRRADCCGRVGGEEFLLLPGCELAQASAIVERLMQRVRLSTPVPLAPHEHYSVSAGLALRQPGEDVTRLYQRADDALYQAKREGRDRLVCAPPPGAATA